MSTTCSDGWKKHFKLSSALSSVGSSESESLTFKAKKKKQKVNISLDGLGIKQVESARFLGVDIDGNINWINQISRVCRSKTFLYTLSSKALSTSCCYAGSMLRIYLSLLSYGNIVWGNTWTTRLEPIRRLQKKLRYKDHYSFK